MSQKEEHRGTYSYSLLNFTSIGVSQEWKKLKGEKICLGVDQRFLKKKVQNLTKVNF
jgi:hypothetical protein